MLLAHAAYYNVPMLKEFDSLVGSLLEMSSRWNGPQRLLSTPNCAENLASKFALRLQHAHRLGPGAIDIRQPAYEDESRVESEASTLLPAQTEQLLTLRSNVRNDSGLMMNGNVQADNIRSNNDASPDSISLAFPPLPLSFQPDHSSRAHTALPSPTLVPLQTHDLLHANNPDITGGVAFEGSTMLDFEDLDAYLQQPFLPTQRISMFSETVHDPGPP